MTPDPPSIRVAFVPGNGHVDARLGPAREVMHAVPSWSGLVLRSVDYGEAESFEALLDGVAAQLTTADVVYATGIGGLVVLALRARGVLVNRRCILQGPVLWGLETRRFPRVMRLPGMTACLVWALRREPLRRRFERTHFLQPLTPRLRRDFFDGYDDARAFDRWFRWLTPDLLRSLERSLRGREDLLSGVEAWWGERDRVVTLDELRRTEKALQVSIALRTFPEWGHYPMIDDPRSWVEELHHALASTRSV